MRLDLLKFRMCWGGSSEVLLIELYSSLMEFWYRHLVF